MQCLSGQVIVRYTKLPIIIQYIIRSGKSKSSEEENLMLISMRVSIVLLSVSITSSRISVIYFD
jgi:hypothetical protein